MCVRHLISTHDKYQNIKMPVSVSRHLSVHFNTKFFKGITNDEIMGELEKHIDLKFIRSIQLTAKECIVSLADTDSKRQAVSSNCNFEKQNCKFF